MKKGMGIALAVLVTAVAAASAQGGQRQVQAASAGVSCKSTLKLAMVTPLTGGAGFLGTEQLSWAKYAVADSRRRRWG